MTDREAAFLQAILDSAEPIPEMKISPEDLPTVALLRTRGFIAKTVVPPFSLAYTLTDTGRIALADYHSERRRRRREDIRFWIATVVAIAALAVSVASFMHSAAKERSAPQPAPTTSTAQPTEAPSIGIHAFRLPPLSSPLPVGAGMLCDDNY